MVLTQGRYLLTFAPLTATPYRDGLRIRRSSLRTNVLLRALTVVPSRNSEEDMRPSPQGLGKECDATHSTPEYANGTLYIVQEVSSNDYDLSKSTDKHPTAGVHCTSGARGGWGVAVVSQGDEW